MKIRSWVKVGAMTTIFKPFDSVSVASMNAVTDEGLLMSRLTIGTNTWMEFVDFLIDVETCL